MEPGGVARHVADLANGLVDKGVRPVVAANDGAFRSRLRKEITFVNLPLYTPGSGRKRLLGLYNSYNILLPILRREHVELIHSHKRYTDVLGRVLARRMSIPHISTCHSVFSSLKHVSFFGDTTIACSKAVQEMLIRDFGKEAKSVAQIYSGIKPFKEIDEREMVRTLNDLAIPKRTRIIAAVGQLTEAKDRATLVRAAGILKRTGAMENVAFVILGDGEQIGELQELVRSEGVSEHVRFLQGTYNVEALFSAAEFMVLTSIREGLPYVLMEAASLGKPHIATDVGGVSEFVVHGETGILVPPRNPQKLSDAIRNLLENPELTARLGKKAKEKFLREFSYERFINQTLEVYKANFADSANGQ